MKVELCYQGVELILGTGGGRRWARAVASNWQEDTAKVRHHRTRLPFWTSHDLDGKTTSSPGTVSPFKFYMEVTAEYAEMG